MKLRLLFLLILLILSNSVSANIEVQAINEDLQAGETFIGRLDLDVKGNLDSSDIRVFEGRRYLFSAEELIRYNDSIFFYMVFPNSGNFNIVIEEVLYLKNSSFFQVDINQTVSIKDSGSDILTISPGIVYGSNPFFYLINRGLTNLDISVQGNKFFVESNKSQKVEVDSSNNLDFVEVSSYRVFKIPLIPFNISKNESEGYTNNTSASIENLSKNETFFNISPNKIFYNLTTNKTVLFNISLVNNLNETIIVSIDSDFSKIIFNNSLELSPLEKKDFMFSFISENPAFFNKTLTFSFNKTSIGVPLIFYVFDLDNNINDGDVINSNNYSCKDIGGEICLVNQECMPPGKVRFLNGFCCVGGQCMDSSEISVSSKKSPFLGFLFVVIAGVIIFFSYKKFKDVKPSSRI